MDQTALLDNRKAHAMIHNQKTGTGVWALAGLAGLIFVAVLYFAVLRPAQTPAAQPAPLPVIDPHNAGQVEQIARLGIGTISHLAWSSDGQQIAVAASRGIYFFDVNSLEEMRYIDPQSWVTNLVFSPDGLMLASGSWDTRLRLWDAASGKLLSTLDHTSSVSSVAFSPDGLLLASGANDLTVHLWDAASGELLRTQDHTSSVSSVAFSPDGRTLASGSMDGTVRLWGVAQP